MNDDSKGGGELLPEKLTDFEVSLYKREASIDRRVVGGKLLLWTASREVMFVQNAPRGERSVEVGRTAHARVVRLKDGRHSVRLRFDARERSIGYQLIAEVREIVRLAAEDMKRQEILKKQNKRWR